MSSNVFARVPRHPRRPTTDEIPRPDAEDHLLGPAEPRVVLVEYGDYEDPACAALHPTLERLRNRFVLDLAVVFRHSPCVDIHPHAYGAALAAEAAADSDRFWVMHELLLSHQDALDDRSLAHYAHELGLPDAGAIGNNSRRHMARVDRDLASGRAAGITAVPALFVGGRRYLDAPDIDSLSRHIRRRLSSQPRNRREDTPR